MNKFWWFLRGYLCVTVTGVGLDRFLNRLSEDRIPYWNIRRDDAFTLRICLFPRDLPAAVQAAQRSQCTAMPPKREGLAERLRGLLHRRIFCSGLLLVLLTVTVLPNFVLFYEVQGNEKVSDEAILRGLEYLGIGFGTFGPSIDPQWVEDHLRNLVDGLQWVTVRQSGCRAVVEVRERPETPQVTDRKGFSNIVAARDAVLLSQSVWTGQPIHQVGDAVVEGELLVSGVVDLERTFLLTRAQAEIFGLTHREYTAAAPAFYEEKGPETRRNTSIWLEIGKHRIKIFGNSGISTAACDKMVDRKILSLPGGFSLPAALVTETCSVRPWTTVREDSVWVRQRLSDCIRETALDRMAGGELLQMRERFSEESELFLLRTDLQCREMIARTVEANWIEEEYAHD